MDFYIGGVIAFVIGLISSWLFWRKRRMTLLQRYGIPGPKPNFWTGNLKEFKREKCTTEWFEKYGKFVGFYLGSKPFIMALDAEFIKIMQVKEFKNFTNKDFTLPDAGISHKSIRKALDLLKDEEWKNMRSYLSAAFSTGSIKKMSHIIITAIELFWKKIKEEDGKAFDILETFNNLNFDIICKATFGVNTDVQNNNTNAFIRSVRDVFGADTSHVLPALSVCFPELEPIPTKLRIMTDALRYTFGLTSVKCIVKTCDKIIESRRKTENPPSDFLQRMIDANEDEIDPPTRTDTPKDKEHMSKSFAMSNEEVIGNALAFMTAGYNTMGTTLGYCSYVLATNTEVQEKARAEIIKNFPSEEEIDYSGLSNLQYLDQVISETLRLYPTLNVVNRVCAEDFKYKDITIPKGTIILVPTWNLQRDTAYWSEPEKFVPERFSPENRGSFDPIAYQPFGAGPRICIGIRFATTMMKLTLANLLRNCKLEKDDQEELEFDYSMFFIKPKNGIHLRAVPLK